MKHKMVLMTGGRGFFGSTAILKVLEGRQPKWRIQDQLPEVVSWNRGAALAQS